VPSGNTLTDVLAEIDRIQAEQPELVSPKAAEAISGRGQTAIADRIRSDKYLSLAIGNRRQIFTSSICDDMREQAVASFESDGVTPRRIRAPSSMYKKRQRPPRERSAAELNALKAANAKRHAEAVERSAAAETKRQTRECADV